MCTSCTRSELSTGQVAPCLQRRRRREKDSQSFWDSLSRVDPLTQGIAVDETIDTIDRLRVYSIYGYSIYDETPH